MKSRGPPRFSWHWSGGPIFLIGQCIEPVDLIMDLKIVINSSTRDGYYNRFKLFKANLD